ncbi:hypothetical protein [Haloferax sp. DFSO52]|uniref:hypothetical protein n=1 Tax=Haloferax sp. DFSO52 TaxID=3388505 RepID=UPI003A8684FD
MNKTDSLPPVIVVSGPDGVGKSTQIDKLTKKFDELNLKYNTVWLRHRHYLSLVVLLISRLTGHTVFDSHKEYQYQYHDFDNNLLGMAYIFTMYVDLLIAYVFRVWIPVVLGRTVICDRGPLDTLIDIHFKTEIEYQNTWLELMYLLLIPMENENIILNMDYADCVHRNERFKYERDFEERVNHYELESSRFNIEQIDASMNVEAVFNSMWAEITD